MSAKNGRRFLCISATFPSIEGPPDEGLGSFLCPPKWLKMSTHAKPLSRLSNLRAHKKWTKSCLVFFHKCPIVGGPKADMRKMPKLLSREGLWRVVAFALLWSIFWIPQKHPNPSPRSASNDPNNPKPENARCTSIFL